MTGRPLAAAAPPRPVERPFSSPTPGRVAAFVAAVPRWAQDAVDPTFLGASTLAQRRDALLRRQLKWLREHSPHYGPRLSGVEIAAAADLPRLEPTTKSDYVADPESFRLRLAPVLHDTLHSVIHTTGTSSGHPTPYWLTTHDLLGIMEGTARGAKACYLVPDDVVVSAFPLSAVSHLTGLASHFYAGFGAAWVSCSTGVPYDDFPVHHPAGEVVDAVERHRATVVMGVGSFLRRAFRDAAASGRDLSSVQVVCTSGEPAARALRDDVRASLTAAGARSVFVTTAYGATEMGTTWNECREQGWLHNAAPDQVHAEVLDPATGEVLPPGTRGALALTHLNRRGTPLLRYLVGDLAALVEGACPDCGRWTQSLLPDDDGGAVTRTGSFTKVRGTLVNPAAVVAAVASVTGVLEHQVAVEVHDGEERLVVRVAPEQGTSLDATAVQEAVRRVSELRPDVHEVRAREIFDPDTAFKAVRFVDRRRS